MAAKALLDIEWRIAARIAVRVVTGQAGELSAGLKAAARHQAHRGEPDGLRTVPLRLRRSPARRQPVAFPARLDQRFRRQPARVANPRGRGFGRMRPARSMAAFAFHSRTQTGKIGPLFYALFYPRAMAIKAPMNGFRTLLLAESGGARPGLRGVADRQARAVLPRVPGHAMLKIPVPDPANLRNPLASRPKHRHEPR